MLTHTSGLRDWGSVMSIAGWPRTTRVHTHAHVLDIVSRQRALNFPSGTRYSYSNTGYNVAAVLVSRVSGLSFAEFSRARIFEPLGLTRTSWRDDFTRVVKDRAIAYSDARDGFRLDMPFENVHGNGGLLTTVGDLLRWTNNFSKSKIGGPTFAREMQEPGRFSDGRQHDYALGLRVAHYKGVREVGHSGSTAGYRAYLASYPERGVAVGVLCNVNSGAAGDYAHAVADIYLGTPPATKATESDVAYTPKPEEMDAVAGDYRDVNTGEPLRVAKSEAGLWLGQAALRAKGTAKIRISGKESNAQAVAAVTAAVATPRPQNGSATQYPISAETRSTSCPGFKPMLPAKLPSTSMASTVSCAVPTWASRKRRASSIR